MAEIWSPVHKHFGIWFKNQCTGNMITCFKISTIIFNHLVSSSTVQNIFLNKFVCVQSTGCWFLADNLIHNWLSCCWLVRLIMATTTITEQVNYYIFTESMAEIMRQLSGKNYCLRVITIHMENRCLNHFGNISTVFS